MLQTETTQGSASELNKSTPSIDKLPPSRDTQRSDQQEPHPILTASDRVLETRGSRLSSDTPSAIGMTRVVTPGSEGAMPRLKERTRSRASGLPTPSRGGRTPKEDPLNILMDSVFLAADNNGDGTLEEKEFWRLLQSPLLNLKLTSADVKKLRARVKSNQAGSVNYVEFLPIARDLIRSVYQDRPRSSSSTWTMLVNAEGVTVGYLNKSSGEIRDTPPEGITFEDPNLIEDTIYDFLEVMDSEQTGIISENMFLESMDTMKSGALGLIITPEELEEIKQIFRLRKDKVPYEDIMPVLLELICRTYQVKDSSYLNWIQLDSPRVGMFWFNKRTGRSKRVMPPEFQELHQWFMYQQQERAQEMTFVQQTIHDLEAANQEILVGRGMIGQLENQVALLNEEMETVMVQLDETGSTLDETTAQLQHKVIELESAKENLLMSEKERDELRGKLHTVQHYCDEIESLKTNLSSLQSEAHDYSRVVVQREGNVSELKRDLKMTGDKLREAERKMEIQDSRLEEMETDVRTQLAKNRDLEEELLRVTELEDKLKTTEGLLEKSDNQLEDKNTALGHARRSLQLAKQKNQELDEELQHMSELREKLHHSRCEINTLKSFLGSKTALVQARDSEIERNNTLIESLQARDDKRAQILSVVLERTSRIQQEQNQRNLIEAKSLIGRPYSAGREHERTLSAPNTFPTPKPPDNTGKIQNQRLAKRIAAESRNKSFKGVLPQLDGKPAQRRRSKPTFSLPNNNELRYLTRIADASIKKDSDLLNVAYFDDPPPPNLKIGDRVLVDASKPGLSALTPRAIAGYVKYIGKVDSTYIDNRYFVGVKLDEALGDCDGTRRGKRYFTCQPQHGILVQSDRVIAVLDKKTLKYVSVPSGGQYGRVVSS
ncbi:hypothetical protein LOD99_4232 [Oopsacas minuta]|uniref:CAP-Gly domain-containing protein n=1 Tax=Oopsacas minuta TaxID=111878 RepID=A0AAV7JW08_9METZ|nr:hypothetical protein LOD99_4232 [Oopsacas minuta]